MRINICIAIVLFLCMSYVSASRTHADLVKELEDLETDVEQLTNGTMTPIPTVPNIDACVKALSETNAAIYEVMEWRRYISACRYITQQTCLPLKTMIRKLRSRQIRYLLAYEQVKDLCSPKLPKAETNGDEVSDEERGDM
jgi:hypothetical protein